MTDPSGGGNHGVVMREYRKGNWTLTETMVLIEAKKMDDERRLRRSIGLSTAEQHEGGRGKPAELRWKWIEDYCWRKGCLRSQNQCNDKWDNLMRDYKKIREYERRRVESSLDAASASASVSAAASSPTSYWKMERSERKERNLPSNMLSQIYDALVEVVEKRVLPSSAAGGSGNGGDGGGGGQMPRLLNQSPSAPIIAQPKHQIPASFVLPLPPPPPPPQLTVLSLPQTQTQTQPPRPSFHAQPILLSMGSSSNSDTSESLDTSSPVKRRKTSEAEAGPSGGDTAAEGSGNDAIGEAIWRSASVIADAIKACEEREDKRHKEIVNLQERRLKMEESKAEINRESMNGLVDAINKLANSIVALASSHHHHQGGPP